jgi:uncharacterized membrane protein HdeD (DUF308 family)
MICFLKNIGILMIIAGVVLLFFYTTQNRINNTHYAISVFLEIAGLIIYILTNRFLNEKDNIC